MLSRTTVTSLLNVTQRIMWPTADVLKVMRATQELDVFLRAVTQILSAHWTRLVETGTAWILACMSTVLLAPSVLPSVTEHSVLVHLDMKVMFHISFRLLEWPDSLVIFFQEMQEDHAS